MDLVNTSSDDQTFNASIHQEIKDFVQFKFWCNVVALRSVCLVGILGNLLTLTVLAKRRLSHRQDGGQLETSMTQSLTALSLSDLCVCLSAPLKTIFDEGRQDGLLAVSVRIYAVAVANTFLAVSIWLTLTITVCRYLAVWQPLRSRSWLTRRKIRKVIAAVFVTAVVLHTPEYFKYLPRRKNCTESASSSDYYCYTYSRLAEVNPDWKTFLGLAYPWLTCGLVNILPLVVMAVCNIKLVLAYRSSRREITRVNMTGGGRGVEAAGAARADSLTPLLATVTVTFFVTIGPAKIVNFICRQRIEKNLQPRLSIQVKDVTAVASYFTVNRLQELTALAQVAGCAMNFILYCLVSQSFRRTMVRAVCPCWHSGKTSRQRATLRGPSLSGCNNNDRRRGRSNQRRQQEAAESSIPLQRVRESSN